MGLDSIWINPTTREQMTLLFDPPLRLVGGMFSEHGSGSFRGKVYDAFITAVTGQTLYDGRIDNATVRDMAARLESFPESDLESEPGRSLKPSDIAPGLLTDDDVVFIQGRSHPYSVEELRDLKRMFRAYADAGAALVGW